MKLDRSTILLCGSHILLFGRCLSYAFSTISPAAVPAAWQQHWRQIEKMRLERVAPVDTMGADALAKRTFLDPAQFRFQTLIATMLSPQTRDEQTTSAYENLKQLTSPGGLRASILMTKSIDQVEEAIKEVSFYKTKAKNILEASRLCVENYGEDIPNDIDELLKFRGVGPKIAYLTFTIARGQTLGICVDTHVHRIANRLGWVNTSHAKSNGPEHTRIALQKVLPEDHWGQVNGLLVGFGQTVCSAKAPKCSECLLSDSCPFFKNNQQ